MKLKKIWINGFKNLNNFELDFTDKNGLTVLVGNNGSGKSNVLEAVSAIFASLFDDTLDQLSWQFEIEYNINNFDILIRKKRVISYKRKKPGNTTYQNIPKNVIYNVLPLTLPHTLVDKPYLPSQVIALYSGEELRLWENYYENAYVEYSTSIRNNTKQIESKQKMLYINKYHWDIALLTMLASDITVSDILNSGELEEIQIKFNQHVLEQFTQRSPNEVTHFLHVLSEGKDSINVTLNDFQELSAYEAYRRLFNFLSVSYLSKQDHNKLIRNIELVFENGLTTKEFSEGEKKKILLKLVLHVLADEDTLILFDEPDSHIHVAHKSQIKSMLKAYGNESILTTHAPTLMNILDDHLVYIENGENIGKEKAEILQEISGDMISIAEQQMVLNTDSDILLVEGKLDIVFIQEAINKLDGYELLENMLFIPTGGASGLRLFIDKFTAKDNQNIIAILDNDKAGKNEVKEILTETYQEALNTNGYVKIEELKNTFLLFLPKPDTIQNTQYEIEDYFPLNKLTEISTEQIATFRILKDFVLKKDTVKKKLAEKCVNFNSVDFEHFKKLFDLIYEIKGL